MKTLQLINEERIAVKTDNGLRLVSVSTIVYIMAVNNCSKIVLSNQETQQISFTLKEIEKQMSAFNFIRCHKSYLVNIAFIDEILYKEKYGIKLINNEEIPVSRAKMKHIKKLFGIC